MNWSSLCRLSGKGKGKQVYKVLEFLLDILQLFAKGEVSIGHLIFFAHTIGLTGQVMYMLPKLGNIEQLFTKVEVNSA